VSVLELEQAAAHATAVRLAAAQRKRSVDRIRPPSKQMQKMRGFPAENAK
jgi:hypothetical protein